MHYLSAGTEKSGPANSPNPVHEILPLRLLCPSGSAKLPNPIRKILPYKPSRLSGLTLLSNPISSPPFPRLGQNVLRSLASVIPHRRLRPEQNYHLHGRPSRCARTHARSFCASRLERTAHLTRETAQERADTASSPKKITSASWTWARYQGQNRVGTVRAYSSGTAKRSFRAI